jgi:hypothetical protein
MSKANQLQPILLLQLLLLMLLLPLLQNKLPHPP